ncbi:MAG: HD domain-containing protein [Nitrososphaeria archaeon]|nr:HD domain-containing protein [Nitrososphaeria archaeon]
MNKQEVLDLVEFLKIAGRLKVVSRSGWAQRGIKDPESVADHIYRTAILSIITARLTGLDELKMLEMVLIHDLSEALLGDLTPQQKREDKEIGRREDAAMDSLLGLLPQRLAKNWNAIWGEYKSGSSREAKIVRQLDQLEMALQATEYFNENRLDQEALEEFLQSASHEITSRSLKTILKSIIK